MPSKAPKQSKESASDPSHVYNAGDIVLAKIKGYPAWPGQILDHDKAPQKVAREKPKTKGINLVQFFPTGDYSWTVSRDLSLLTPKEIDTYLSSTNKKKGDLLEGYRIAQDPQAWNQEKADALAEYESLMEQAGEDEDQLAESEEEGGKAGKKRKRAAEPKKDEKKGKKAKTEKAAGKKAAGKKDDDEAPASKKNKTNSADPGAENVKSWRHKLQKVFLGKTAPAADEMPKCAEYFDAMESFEMKKEWLQESKLAKVLKRIALMKEGTIPDEDKYSFRERSSALASKWTALLNGADESSPKPEGEDAAPAAAEKENGDAEPKGEENGEAAEKSEEAGEAEEKKGAEEEKKDEEKMEVDEQPKENGDAKEDAPAADAEEKKDDAPAAESS
ncbi:hypothetical protein JCM10213_003885 [Rhodosporidiobolus nylandii]